MRARFVALVALAGFACDLDGGEGAVAPVLAGSKADAGDHVQMREPLVFGGSRDAAFVEDLEFHGYPLSVRPGSTVTLEVSHAGSSSKLDATMFVYGPRTPQGWGTEAIAFDDDGGWGRLPRLRDLELQAGGDYLVVIGTHDARGRGHYRVRAQCASASGDCAPEPVGCVFGEVYRDILQNPRVVVTSARRLTSLEALDTVQDTFAEQLIAAVHESSHTDVATVEEAFERVDEGEFNVRNLWDVSNDEPFTVVEYGAGDNSYGAVFRFGTTDIVAQIHDGDLLECSVAAGPGGVDCRADDECSDGRRCVGHHPELEVGRCVAATDAPEVGGSCTAEAPCDPVSGLACAGLTRFEEGACLPAWMRGTTVAEPFQTIGADGYEASFEIYGLAEVDTDVEVDVIAFGGTAGPARVTLTNPASTEVVVWEGNADGDLYKVDVPVLGFSGDEQVVGTWTLNIEGVEGATVQRLTLRVGSRPD